MSPTYEIIRSARKTLAVEVTRDCRVKVRAPLHLSEKRIAAFVQEKEAWISGALARQEERAALHPPLGTEEIEALRRAAKAVLPQRTAYFAEKMGVEPAFVGINSAKTRFGSCTAEKRIHFSLYLMAYPPQAIDYVVVHELAHILFHDHSKAFYSCIEQILPDYRQRAALLKK